VLVSRLAVDLTPPLVGSGAPSMVPPIVGALSFLRERPAGPLAANKALSELQPRESAPFSRSEGLSRNASVRPRETLTRNRMNETYYGAILASGTSAPE